MYSVLYYGCNEYGQNKENNLYTKNHIDFNLQALQLLVSYNAIQLLLNLLITNGGFRTRVRCIDITWAMLCILVRVGLIGGLIYLLPSFFDTLCKAWHLDQVNWWRTDTEDWITNVSKFNALVCWLLWLLFQIINWFLVAMILL